MWVYTLISLSFSPKPLWKFYNDNFCEHFAFYSCSNWHLFLHFCEASLAATDEKVNLVRSCQPKLAAAAFVFVHPKCRPLVPGPGHRLTAQRWCQHRVKLESWSPATGSGLGRGAKSSWGNDEMRWGRPAEYGIQLAVVSPLHVFPSQPLGSSLAQLRTRFRPRASLLRVTENNAKFRVLNLANVHRKLLSI